MEDNDEKIVDKKEANTDAKNSDINNNKRPIKRKNYNISYEDEEFNQNELNYKVKKKDG